MRGAKEMMNFVKMQGLTERQSRISFLCSSFGLISSDRAS